VGHGTNHSELQLRQGRVRRGLLVLDVRTDSDRELATSTLRPLSTARLIAARSSARWFVTGCPVGLGVGSAAAGASNATVVPTEVTASDVAMASLDVPCLDTAGCSLITISPREVKLSET
jgi:hypothetical protein